ncbi:ABC transporter ATP-binding protein [Paenibacillus sp. D51F]
MSIPAIEVKNLSKDFKVAIDKKNTFKERFLRFGKQNSISYPALDNVTIKIKEGETVALMGRNGSGKSTLLKIMSKIIFPTKGEMNIRGRVSSLLELGAGFHPEFSGRENIFMNASILGLSKKEINSKLEDIIKFSELEDFIERPVRVYSSGMYMRLAFSIAINVEPDILLIDEILAVGDSAFQNKCINKIKELKGQGKTIIIVTHDNGMVERLCDRAVWLHNGKVIETGEPRDVIMKYMYNLSEMENSRMIKEAEKTEKKVQTDSVSSNSTKIDNGDLDRWGNKKISIEQVQISNINHQIQRSFQTNEGFVIQIHYKVRTEFQNAVFGIGIFTPNRVCCYGTNTYIDKINIKTLPPSGIVEFKVESLNLVAGEYWLDVAIHHEDGEPYDYISKELSFQVHNINPDTGIAWLDHEWKIKSLE